MRMWSDLPYCYAGLATLMEGGNASVARGGGGNRIRGGVGAMMGAASTASALRTGQEGWPGSKDKEEVEQRTMVTHIMSRATNLLSKQRRTTLAAICCVLTSAQPSRHPPCI
jgi:hypothetical protein